MRSLASLVLVSAVSGLVLGAALGYYQAQPWAVVEYSNTPNGSKASERPAHTGKLSYEVPEKVFNFGKMERGTTMEHEFKIINTGETPISVNVTGSTCKCTVGELEKSKIGPGEETNVLLEWTAKTTAGPFRHGARLTVTPGGSQIELNVEGEVVESSSIYPGELLFGDIRVGEVGTAQLFVISSLQSDVQVTDYSISDPELAERMKVEFTPVEKNELPDPAAMGGMKVTATYQADQTIGRFRGWLELKTNLENAPRRSILTAGNKIGDITIYGDAWDQRLGLLRMGAVKSGKGKQVRLNLNVRGETAKSTEFKVLRIDPPQLQATLGEHKALGEALMSVPLMVELPAGTAPMVRKGEPASSDAMIELETNHPSAQEVLIRVHFTVEP